MSYKTNPRTDSPRNGMLTDSQREYLRSDRSGYSDQNKRDYEEAIKQRVYNTLLDFSLLFENWDRFEKWDRNERKQLLQKSGEREDLDKGIASLLALVYLENSKSAMERFLSQAVRMAEEEASDSGFVFPMDVNFKAEPIRRADFDEAIRKFRAGNLSDLSDEEMRAVIGMLKHAPDVDEEMDRIQESVNQYYEEILSEYN